LHQSFTSFTRNKRVIGGENNKNFRAMRGFGVRNARHWSDKCDDACARGTGEQRDMYRNFEQRKFEQPRKHWSKVR